MKKSEHSSLPTDIEPSDLTCDEASIDHLPDDETSGDFAAEAAHPIIQSVPEHLGAKRFDQIAAEVFPHYSRSRLKAWIEDGLLTVDGQRCKPREKLFGGQNLELIAQIDTKTQCLPEDIPLNIVFEDDHLLVINKPDNLVVHPGAGNYNGTLLNGLLFHDENLAKLPRVGIVHRLDKDTTGLMVVAKSLLAHKSLVEQLQERTMGREYEAITQGVMTGGGTVDEPIGRHSIARTKMAVNPNGKPAVTHYRVLKRFRAHTHVRLKLESGRTHQIRVHMTHIHSPLVGDQTYGQRLALPKGASESLKVALRNFPRQALHACELTLEHPVTQELMSWEAPAPRDFQLLLSAFEQDLKYNDD